ncbi:MAG: hypothetical protein AABX00_05970 [Nanoarchaeota archaeon]
MTSKNFRIFSKKAQLAIFMIIAVVLIIGGVVFFTLTSEEEKTAEAEIMITESVPIEFEPVKKFVEDCLYATSVEGLELIGEHGGYASLDENNLNAETFAVNINNPTESDAVLFASDSNLKIPYWNYLKSANSCKGNCVFASKRPKLSGSGNSIQENLQRYVDAKLSSCTDNFKTFKEQGYAITEKSKPKSSVVITQDDVVIGLDYELSIERQDSSSSPKKFATRVPINLQRVYELATNITNLEIRHNYIEKHVLNLIAAFSGVDNNKLPPMSEMQFKFGSNVGWQKTQVKNNVENVLLSYIPLFQLDSTANYERNVFDTELAQRLYDSTIIPIADEKFKDLETHFSYLDFWPMYFNLNCNGENCKPNSANSLISFLGVQDYKFFYDLSFPVLVQVQDPLALNGKGYTFNLFLEGNIRNNEPLKAAYDPLEISYESEKSLLCDSRNSGEVKVNVLDSSQKPIQDAQVVYTVGDETCFIGTTDETGTVKEKFPIAAGGAVSVSKENFIGKYVDFDAQLDADSSLSVKLKPITTKNIIVRKKSIVKTQDGWEFVNTPADLTAKESATISLTRVNDNGELDFSSAAQYTGQQTEKSTIEIAPGNYEADITLLLNEKIVIPAQRKCPCVLWTGICAKRECYDLPEIDFSKGAAAGSEKFPSGGLKAKISISPENLKDSNTIILYAVSVDLLNVPLDKRDVEDANEIGKVEEYSTTYQTALTPEFKNG